MLYDNAILNVFCSRLTIVSWLQNHLLPCPFKYITGIDCPGCGFQRAIVALLQGDMGKSWTLYPPAIPLLLFFIYGFADKKFKLDNRHNAVKKTLYMLVDTFIEVSYGYKIWHVYLAHYNILS